MKIQQALISVSDKSGVESFAKGPTDLDVQIVSTGGTAKLLRDSGIPVTLVEKVTGIPETLDGRVKRMHPKLTAGILARRDVPEHMETIAKHDIEPIDMVVCNLYPFEDVAGRRRSEAMLADPSSGGGPGAGSCPSQLLRPSPVLCHPQPSTLAARWLQTAVRAEG